MTGPYLVLTVVPSTIGRRSRWTPWRETSGPREWPSAVAGDLVDLVEEDDPGFLGEPDGGGVDLLGVEQGVRSWAIRSGRAWATVTFSAFAGRGIIFSSIPWRSISICSMFPAPRIETGAADRPGRRHLDLAVVERARPEFFAHLLAGPCLAFISLLVGGSRCDSRGLGQEQVEQALLGPLLGLGDDPSPLGCLDQQ